MRKKKNSGRCSKVCKGIWQRLNFMGRIKEAAGYLFDSLTSFIPDSVFSRLEAFFYKKWKKSAKKLVDVCKKNNVDPRYYLIKTLPEDEQYNFAKSLDYVQIYSRLDDCPEIFLAQYAHDCVM